jgi:hypothetical protein
MRKVLFYSGYPRRDAKTLGLGTYKYLILSELAPLETTKHSFSSSR